MRINDMDKYQVTEVVKKAKKIICDPGTDFHFYGLSHEEVLEVVKEITNPVTDEEGYVHKYYLSDGAKILIEILIKPNNTIEEHLCKLI